MIKRVHQRRALSAALIVLGAVLIFLAPDNVWIGALLAILGVVIELIAFRFVHHDEGKG